jgi:predicted metal-dependent enzyme (double-stranded beta helix superfamily)
VLNLPFPGSRQLIDAIDVAVSQPDTAALTSSLRASLCHFMSSGEVQLPACVFVPCAEHYARRELYRSEEHGYCVVAMTWAPGQGTPIHDHDGMWCVEGVWHGALDIQQYDLQGHSGERWEFSAIGSIHAAAGSAGSLIPPHEYHSIRNPSDDAVTVSLHVYAGPMLRCSVFQPLPDGHGYARDMRVLGLDRAQ